MVDAATNEGLAKTRDINGETTLETSGEDVQKLHSKRVGKMCKNYTRNEWRRCRNTLETSGEDAGIHSKRVGKMREYTRNEWRRCGNTLETSGEDVKGMLSAIQNGNAEDIQKYVNSLTG